MALAHREAGVSKRHLWLLARHGQIKLLAENISPSTQRQSTNSTPAKDPPIASEDEASRYPEGRESYREHRRLERDPSISKKAKANRLAETKMLKCDVCGFDFQRTYGELGARYIEAHHTIPVSVIRGIAKTKINDLALVCSNCHRMLHRGPRLLSVAELKKLLRR